MEIQKVIEMIETGKIKVVPSMENDGFVKMAISLIPLPRVYAMADRDGTLNVVIGNEMLHTFFQYDTEEMTQQELNYFNEAMIEFVIFYKSEEEIVNVIKSI